MSERLGKYFCMLMLAIIFALTGAALGLRFKALVLVPASGFAVASPS